MQRPGRGNVSPLGQAHPRTGVLIRSDNPRRVQLVLHHAYLHSQALLIPARLGCCPCLNTHGRFNLSTQVRRPDLSVFCLCRPVSFSVNCILSYYGTRQSVYKQVGERQNGSMSSNERICISCWLEHILSF